MIEHCISARIPIIALRTRDTVNTTTILDYLLETKVVPFDKSAPTAHKYTFLFKDFHVVDGFVMHQLLSRKGCTLFLINPKEIPLAAFDAGTLPTPPALMRDLFEGGVPDSILPNVLKAVSGLTLKEAFEVANLAGVSEHKITVESIKRMRPKCVESMIGLTPTNTEIYNYVPNSKLQDWVATAGKFINIKIYKDLIPRGLLLTGVAGSGKSAAAKYIANELKIPLFTLNISGLLRKYVGESEAHLKDALHRIELESPAVMLIDEVEKLFVSDTSTPVTNSLLAILLWWLQEHTSRVLTIMTTNNASIIPVELYRAGRIDEVIEFNALTKAEADAFMKTYRAKYDDLYQASSYDVFTEGSMYTHADIIAKCKHLTRLDVLMEMPNP